MLTTRVLTCWTCHFQSGSLFFVYFGFLCLQVSSVSNFHPDTGGEGSHLLRLTCSIVLQGGMNTVNKCHWHVWGVLAVSGPHWVCPCSWRVCFPSLHCSGSRLLCRGTKASPALRTLPRSKLFRFSGTPQGHRLGWACVLCPSQVWAAQVTRCLASAHTPGGAVHLITSLVLAALFPSVQRERCLRCAVCLHGELIPGCDPPGGCQLSRIPGRLG